MGQQEQVVIDLVLENYFRPEDICSVAAKRSVDVNANRTPDLFGRGKKVALVLFCMVMIVVYPKQIMKLRE